MKRIRKLSLGYKITILLVLTALVAAGLTSISSASAGYWRPHGHDCESFQGGGPCMEWTGTYDLCCSGDINGTTCLHYQAPHPAGFNF